MLTINDEQRNAIKKAVADTLEPMGIQPHYVTVKYFRTGDSDGYFDTHRNIWEQIKSYPDNVELYTNENSLWEHITEQHSIELSAGICNIPSECADWIDDWFNDNMSRKLLKIANDIDNAIEDYEDESEVVDHVINNWTLDEFSKLGDELTAHGFEDNGWDEFEKRVYNWAWGTDPEACGEPELDPSRTYDDRDEIGELFGVDVDEAEITMRDDMFEGLAYWTLYFEPRYMDATLADECGLIAFRWTDPDTEDDMELLALGGCGMDLSPKLDAYRAISTSTVPVDSRFISDPVYAKHVVGGAMFDRVMAEITLDTPTIIISTREINDDTE